MRRLRVIVPSRFASVVLAIAAMGTHPCSVLEAQQASASAESQLQGNNGIDPFNMPLIVGGCQNVGSSTNTAAPAHSTVTCMLGSPGNTLEASAWSTADFSGTLRAYASIGANQYPIGATSAVTTVARTDMFQMVTASPGVQSATFYVALHGNSLYDANAFGDQTTWVGSGFGFFGFGAGVPTPGANGWTGYVWNNNGILQLVGNTQFIGYDQILGPTANTPQWQTPISGMAIFHAAVSGSFALDMGLQVDASLINNGLTPVDITNTVVSDYSGTAQIAGVRLFDASGNDITSNSWMKLASGAYLPLGDPTTAPEPPLLLLTGSGLAGLSIISVRRRRRR